MHPSKLTSHNSTQLHADAASGYDTKPADSEGLALGTLTIPWTFTALFITDRLRKGYTSGSPGRISTMMRWFSLASAMLCVHACWNQLTACRVALEEQIRSCSCADVCCPSCCRLQLAGMQKHLSLSSIHAAVSKPQSTLPTSHNRQPTQHQVKTCQIPRSTEGDVSKSKQEQSRCPHTQTVV